MSHFLCVPPLPTFEKFALGKRVLILCGGLFKASNPREAPWVARKNQNSFLANCSTVLNFWFFSFKRKEQSKKLKQI